MDKTRAAMQQALVFVESLTGLHIEVKEERDEISTALREALDHSGEANKMVQDINLNCKSVQKRLATVWGYVKAEQAEQEPVAQQDSDDRLLLREIFMLCEATEELESTNDFMRGRIFEAKCIRRGIGTWYQDTFCGRSYMGEPVLNAAPVQQAEQEPVGMVIGGVVEPWNDDILSGSHELYAAPVQPMNQEPLFRCTSCGGVYIDAPTQCDCMPNVQEYDTGYMVFCGSEPVQPVKQEPVAIVMNELGKQKC